MKYTKRLLTGLLNSLAALALGVLFISLPGKFLVGYAVLVMLIVFAGWQLKRLAWAKLNLGEK